MLIDHMIKGNKLILKLLIYYGGIDSTLANKILIKNIAVYWVHLDINFIIIIL